jgi:chemotaxis protein CheZ
MSASGSSPSAATEARPNPAASPAARLEQPSARPRCLVDLLDLWRAGDSDAGRALVAELQGLSSQIRRVRLEVAAADLADLNGVCIPDAKDQLEAVVDMSGEATHRIMDAAEALEAAAEEAAEPLRTKLQAATSEIYEACTFQDITGQRVRKVVRALQDVDRRLSALLQTFSADENPGPRTAPGARATASSEGHGGEHLEGPQLAGGGISQDAVDALFDD